jgi:hypothetical protein
MKRVEIEGNQKDVTVFSVGDVFKSKPQYQKCNELVIFISMPQAAAGMRTVKDRDKVTRFE